MVGCCIHTSIVLLGASKLEMSQMANLFRTDFILWPTSGHAPKQMNKIHIKILTRNLKLLKIKF